MSKCRYSSFNSEGPGLGSCIPERHFGTASVEIMLAFEDSLKCDVKELIADRDCRQNVHCADGFTSELSLGCLASIFIDVARLEN